MEPKKKAKASPPAVDPKTEELEEWPEDDLDDDDLDGESLNDGDDDDDDEWPEED